MSLKGIAKETLAFLDAGGFASPGGVAVTLQPQLSAAIEGTRLFTPEELERLLAESPADKPAAGPPPRIEVTGETTQVAAHRLTHVEGVEDLVLLNFASARNAGGRGPLVPYPQHQPPRPRLPGVGDHRASPQRR